MEPRPVGYFDRIEERPDAPDAAHRSCGAGCGRPRGSHGACFIRSVSSWECDDPGRHMAAGSDAGHNRPGTANEVVHARHLGVRQHDDSPDLVADQTDADGWVAVDSFLAKDHPMLSYRLMVTLFSSDWTVCVTLCPRHRDRGFRCIQDQQQTVRAQRRYGRTSADAVRRRPRWWFGTGAPDQLAKLQAMPPSRDPDSPAPKQDADVDYPAETVRSRHAHGCCSRSNPRSWSAHTKPRFQGDAWPAHWWLRTITSSPMRVRAGCSAASKAITPRTKCTLAAGRMFAPPRARL